MNSLGLGLFIKDGFFGLFIEAGFFGLFLFLLIELLVCFFYPSLQPFELLHLKIIFLLITASGRFMISYRFRNDAEDRKNIIN